MGVHRGVSVTLDAKCSGNRCTVYQALCPDPLARCWPRPVIVVEHTRGQVVHIGSISVRLSQGFVDSTGMTVAGRIRSHKFRGFPCYVYWPCAGRDVPCHKRSNDASPCQSVLVAAPPCGMRGALAICRYSLWDCLMHAGGVRSGNKTTSPIIRDGRRGSEYWGAAKFPSFQSVNAAMCGGVRWCAVGVRWVCSGCAVVCGGCAVVCGGVRWCAMVYPHFPPLSPHFPHLPSFSCAPLLLSPPFPSSPVLPRFFAFDELVDSPHSTAIGTWGRFPGLFECSFLG